jgi:hypothetical protein
MLMAYEDLGQFKIADYPTEEARIGPYPIDTYSKARKIFEWAEREHAKHQWKLEENDKKSYRVRE